MEGPATPVHTSVCQMKPAPDDWAETSKCEFQPQPDHAVLGGQICGPSQLAFPLGISSTAPDLVLGNEEVSSGQFLVNRGAGQLPRRSRGLRQGALQCHMSMQAHVLTFGSKHSTRLGRSSKLAGCKAQDPMRAANYHV